MPDTVDQATRSRMMAAIRSSDTRPELVLRRSLHARGLRFRLHDRKLPGTPDLVFRQFMAVCFVHGCFWHRHAGCPYANTPSTREDYWRAKFDANVERDRRNRAKLLEAGWRVAVIWECSLRKRLEPETVMSLDQWLHENTREFCTGPFHGT